MTNRYAGEIHINPVRILRNDDFNNDGLIKDIQQTLAQAIELNHAISNRLQQLKKWMEKENNFSAIQFRFSESGHISVSGLSDDQLKMLASKGLIELFDLLDDVRQARTRCGHQERIEARQR